MGGDFDRDRDRVADDGRVFPRIAPYTVGNKVTLLQVGREVFEAMLRDVRQVGHL